MHHFGYERKNKKGSCSYVGGVDYLFIDKVSMIGCNFLLKISEALTEAKQKMPAFRGMNIIFAGDLAQLPLV